MTDKSTAVRSLDEGLPRGWRVREIAESLGLAPSSVYRAIDRGELIAVRVGQALLVLESDLDAFLEARRTAKNGSRGVG